MQFKTKEVNFLCPSKTIFRQFIPLNYSAEDQLDLNQVIVSRCRTGLWSKLTNGQCGAGTGRQLEVASVQSDRDRDNSLTELGNVGRVVWSHAPRSGMASGPTRLCLLAGLSCLTPLRPPPLPTGHSAPLSRLIFSPCPLQFQADD
ncbi:hypothetical protein J6590_009982 [Homalodisca vitripennis]|nr:hypothetical protein J6590_009982 [Homalodisca vitripennis]